MMHQFRNTRQKLLLAALIVALSASSAWSISWWGKRDNREGLLTMVRNRVILFPEEGAAKPAALNDAFQINDRIKTRSRSPSLSPEVANSVARNANTRVVLMDESLAG